MTVKKGRSGKVWLVYLVFIVVLSGSAWLATRWLSNNAGKPVEPRIPEKIEELPPEPITAEEKPIEPAPAVATEEKPVGAPSEMPAPGPVTEDITQPESLVSIIRSRTTWNPTMTEWYGKEAPDFTFHDLAGKTHKLAEYRGKNIMVVFWATWCGPCHAEIPHLIELRNEISADELAIIGISNESLDKIKPFAESKEINYTVTSIQSHLPVPFTYVRAIPTSFYIDKKGKIKLIVEGVATKQEFEAILKAPHLVKP